MTDELEQQVHDRQWQHDVDELSGRATPPDRLDDILARVATRAGSRTTARRPSKLRPAHLWAAALILLGLTATISVSMATPERDQPEGADPGRPGGAATAAQVQLADSGDRGAGQIPQPQQNRPPKVGPQPSGQEPANEQGPAGDQPKPKGTDPADLAALRSAEAMLEAEKKLADLLREGKITGFDKLLPFDELSDWHYRDGLDGLPEKIKALSDTKVLMTGFMLPIDEVEGMRQFLLVKSLWSCCYGQPPNIHGLVRCVLPEGKESDYVFDPLKVIGTFRVEATVMDGYCVDIYQLHVESLEPIE